MINIPSTRQKTAIITDSTADIPKDICSQLNITVVPNIVIIDGESYRDGIDITRKEFYDRLPDTKSPPTTSTASLGTYQTTYNRLFENGIEEIISVHLPPTLSSVFNTASLAAREFNGRVTVIDSRQLSLGMGFQVIEAAKAAVQNATVSEIIKFMDDVRRRVRLIAMLDTLEFIHRSGRVSWASAIIGNLLRFKQFVEVKEAKVINLFKIRSRKKGIQQLLDLINHEGKLEYFAILHSNAEDDARKILSQIKSQPLNPPMVINATTSIGTHVGPNGLGYASVSQ